jgi:hypothetical protein
MDMEAALSINLRPGGFQRGGGFADFLDSTLTFEHRADQFISA